MDFDQLRRTVAESLKSDWHVIDRLGPTYRTRFTSPGDPDQVEGVQVDSHSTQLVYKPDINLTITHGMCEYPPGRSPSVSPFKGTKFSDPEITVRLADLFWTGTLVVRVRYAEVDGGRGFLPLGAGSQGKTVTRFDFDVVRLIDQLARHHDFDRYADAVSFDFKDDDSIYSADRNVPEDLDFTNSEVAQTYLDHPATEKLVEDLGRAFRRMPPAHQQRVLGDRLRDIEEQRTKMAAEIEGLAPDAPGRAQMQELLLALDEHIDAMRLRMMELDLDID